ncbi:MAG: hypothetical protein WCQ95_09700 [Bacteroidota bacterium]
MRKVILSICFCIVKFNVMYSQNVDFKLANFSEQKAKLEVAKSNLSAANKYFNNDLYIFALKLYLQAYDLNPSNAELNYKIGMCYFLSGQQYKAAAYFEKTESLAPNKYKDIQYFLAESYQYNLEFDKAIVEFGVYKKLLSDNDLAILGGGIERKIKECKIAKDYVSNYDKNITIMNLGPQINSVYSEYTPLVIEDGTQMYFTSQGNDTLEYSKKTSQINEHILITEKENNYWTSAIYADSPFNNKKYSSVVTLVPANDAFIVYRGDNGGDLYETRFVNNKFTEFESLGDKVNTEYKESSASVTADGKYLYFTSDRPGGKGGSDIYVSRLIGKGKWGKPKNLGPSINTLLDEDGVSISPDGKTLYFSSQGFKGMGGFDVYKSVLVNNKWSKDQNMGYPINTPGDDIYFQICKDERSAYYTSQRPEGFGGADIYYVTFNFDKPNFDTSIQPDTALFSVINHKLDSAGFKDFYAQVQIGAYYNKTVVDFKNYYPSLQSCEIHIESVPIRNGKFLLKFILDKKFKTIEEAAIVQKEMWNVHKITDAFVAIYNMQNQRIAIYNTISQQFVILKGDEKPVYF